jgi:hypothetical protein
MAKAAPKKKAGAKKAARKSSAAEAPVKKKAAPSKAAAKKAAPKKPAPKKAAGKMPAKRPAVRPPGKKKAAAANVAAKRPVGRGRAPGRKAAVQKFNVSHLNEADFKADALRSYAHYRDLGIAAASGGLCQAHVIRLIPPCTDEVRKRHDHAAELQLIYVLRGWIKNEFEGHGVQMMSAGTCWLQPPGIKHTVLDYSADCEMLEIVVPADFKTAEVA